MRKRLTPSSASPAAIAFPMPLLAPMTAAVRPCMPRSMEPPFVVDVRTSLGPGLLVGIHQPLTEPAGSLPGSDLEMRHIAVHAHVRALLLYEELLLGRGDLPERGDLTFPHREVVALRHDHQRRCVEDAGGERADVVGPDELGRRDRAVVLVPR